jgi:hypothetical protein
MAAGSATSTTGRAVQIPPCFPFLHLPQQLLPPHETKSQCTRCQQDVTESQGVPIEAGFGHLEQVWQMTGAAPPSLPVTALCRHLTSSAPRAPYRRRQKEPKSVCHWGQRKLLLSEVEFLTSAVGPSPAHVVYAGAAPGTHLTLLAALFPLVRFTLVDPSPFSPPLATLHNASTVQGFFSTALAQQLKAGGRAATSCLHPPNQESGKHVEGGNETLPLGHAAPPLTRSFPFYSSAMYEPVTGDS